MEMPRQLSVLCGQQRPKDLLMRINESSLKQAKLRVYACNDSPCRFILNRLARWASC